MPLSEQEQRLLDEMERSLYQNDAEFAASVRGVGGGRGGYGTLIGGVLLAVVGVGVLILGVVLQQPVVGVLGFAVMFGGVLLAVSTPKRRRPTAGAPKGGAAGGPARSSRQRGLMDRLNERWDRRRDPES